MVYPQIQYLGPAHTEPRERTNNETRELDSRSSDGIHVCLLWHPNDARISVAVNDTKTGEAFELPVPDPSRALDVFHHPYAHTVGAAPASPAPRPASLAFDSRRTPTSRARNEGI